MKNQHTINNSLLNTIIRELTRTRNNINDIRDYVRGVDAGTIMCQLGQEVWSLDTILEKLNYIKSHPIDAEDNTISYDASPYIEYSESLKKQTTIK